MIPFNKPCSTGDEIRFIRQAMHAGHVAGNGQFTKRCMQLVRNYFGFDFSLFTPSCASALEMCAPLCNFKPGDEVIVPSFTHVSTANAFIRGNAAVKFADCLPGHPNIDPSSVASLINSRTRALVVVHYAGIACDMPAFRDLADAHGLILIEDAAHALGSTYRNRWLGSWGDLATFSFHETKNITCGHGGMLVVNNQKFQDAAIELWHQGTDRAQFEQGTVPYYTWVRPAASFQLSEINAACLYAQLRQVSQINERRMLLWKKYETIFSAVEYRHLLSVPSVPPEARHNAHIFYVIAHSNTIREDLLHYLNGRGFQAVFHYVPLHASPYGSLHSDFQSLPNAERISTQLLRLPLYDSLEPAVIEEISVAMKEWALIAVPAT